MNTCTSCRRPSLTISFDRPFHDEKLSYVESVCSALVESRFGAATHYQQLRTRNAEPGTAVPVISFLSGEGLVPAWGLARSPSNLKRLIDAAREASRASVSPDHESLAHVFPTVASMPGAIVIINALGRGSPINGPPLTHVLEQLFSVRSTRNIDSYRCSGGCGPTATLARTLCQNRNL